MKVEMNASRKNCIYQFVVLTIVAVITATKAEVDCNERPPFMHPKDCCQIPNIITDDIKETCKQFMKSNHGPPGAMRGPPHQGPPHEGRQGPPHRGPPHGRGHHDHCFLSCVLNATGILIDDELQQITLESYLADTIEDPDVVEIIGGNFIECSEEIKEMREQFSPPPGSQPSNSACTPHGGMIVKCAMMKTFEECPDSVWSNTDDCNTAREYFIECRPPRRPEEPINEIENEEI